VLIKEKYFFEIILIIFLTACSKKPDTGDKIAPVITITSPSNNQHFTAGQTINTTASATDNDKVTELHIHVTDKTTGALLRDIHSYPGQSSGTVEDSFVADPGIFYTIVIIAKDPAQNLATAMVEVSSN
jgi:Bacterial Ig domain